MSLFNLSNRSDNCDRCLLHDSYLRNKADVQMCICN